MRKISRNILLLVLAVVGMAPVMAGSKNGGDNAAAMRRDKARYIYLEALRQREAENNGAFHDLIRHAYATDSSNSAISYYYGLTLLMRQNVSREDAERGVNLMRRHVEAHPGDYYEAYTYANLLPQIGRNEEALATWKKLAELFPTKVEVQGQLADCYARNEKYAEAIATFDSLEKVLGISPDLLLRKITYYYQMRDTAGIIEQGRRLLRSAPGNAQYNYVLGHVFQSVQMNDSAICYFDKSIALAPDNGLPYLDKANIYMLSGDSVAYDREINNALVSKDLDVESKVAVLVDYIKQLFARQDTTERVNRLFTVLLGQHPHEAAIHDLYSEYFVAKKDYKRAAEQMQYVLDIDPANAESWKRLMMVNLMAEQYPQAIAAGDKALEYNPDNIDLYQYIGPAYYTIKEYDKAMEVYDRCLAIADSLDYKLRSSVLTGKGDVYYALKDTARSFACYEEALRLDPANVSLMNNYAYFLTLEDKDLDKAERLSAKAVNAQPDNATFLDTYAWVFFKKGDYKLALIYIEHALSNDKGSNAEVLEHYGDILFMNGEPERAVEQWQKALELDPERELLKRKVDNKTYFYK